ncbi:hypothetical protein [Actinokineospora sp. HUAS TT18]|uniref:hypothetical protein n=1 Tax=Actinokineospora sp. HUAS TT18 TaxID=3447451 RepID=UPI003F5266B7
MTRSSTSDLGRVVRMFWPGTGGLARPVDWLESGVLAAVVLLGLLSVPVAAAIGTESYVAAAAVAGQGESGLSPGGAVAAGVVSGLIALIIALFGLVLLFQVVKWVLDRHRARRWAADLARMRVDRK